MLLMKKAITLISIVLIMTLSAGFKLVPDGSFSDSNLYDLQKIYEVEEVEACALGRTKTYMDYRAITNTSSSQYWYIRNYMEVDETTGFLLDEDGFIGIALGSYFGPIGTRYYITLDTGIVLPVVKIEEKADKDTDSKGCAQKWDGSVIEFVINADIANNYYGYYGNGLVLQGNFSNYSIYQGSIEKIERVLDEKIDNYVTYKLNSISPVDYSIFNYASGY